MPSIAFVVLLAFGAAPSPLEGLYRAAGGRNAVRIECRDGRCEGRIPPDVSEKDVAGKVVLKDLVPAGEVWKGTGVLPRKGKEFPVEVSMPDSSTLRVRGKFGLLGGTRDWKRVR